MPELPEVETVRLSIAPRVLKARVLHVNLTRADMAKHEDGSPATQRDLLLNDTISALHRRGKQLALIGSSGRIVIVQLGMSGQLFCRPAASDHGLTHVHCTWTLERARKNPPLHMIFRDPRRFGGLTCLPDQSALHARWEKLGPDGLEVTHVALTAALRGSHRSLKAALLDQAVVAGIGNIYADEICFISRIRPTRCAARVTGKELRELAANTPKVLAAAVKARGSTFRDHRDGEGNEGTNQHLLKVYGRGGKPCVVCATTLTCRTIAQRTTVWCRSCQR